MTQCLSFTAGSCQLLPGTYTSPHKEKRNMTRISIKEFKSLSNWVYLAAQFHLAQFNGSINRIAIKTLPHPSTTSLQVSRLYFSTIRPPVTLAQLSTTALSLSILRLRAFLLSPSSLSLSIAYSAFCSPFTSTLNLL